MVMTRIFRTSLLALPLLFASIVPPAIHAITPPDSAISSRMQLQSDEFADRGFSSGFELFYAGPEWFLNALSNPRSRNPFIKTFAFDNTGDRLGAENGYVGTLRDVFDVGLFSNISTFTAASGGKTSSPNALAATGTPKDFFQNTDMTSGTNYTPTGLPTNINDVRITRTSTTGLRITSGTLTAESLNVENGNSFTISNATTGGTNSTLNLGNSAGFTNFFSGLNDDLIYLTNNSSLVIQGPNASSGSGVLNLVLASSGNFNVGSTSILNISSVISGAGFGPTISNSGTVIFGGANTYSGDTVINAGDLRFAPGGSSNSSTIRLGNTINNSPSATLSLGNSFGSSSGVTLASPLEVRASSSGTQGTRLLRSLTTTGTNTYSGVITMNADLTLQSSSNLGFSQGTLLLQGGSIDIKNHVLRVDDALDGTPGNLNTQGIVTINELISGTGGSVVKTGGGTLFIQSTSNTYTGGTTIGGGLLGIYGDQSLGAVPASPGNNIQFTGNATLQDTANNVSLAANRDISIASGITARFDSNGNTFSIAGVINGSGNLNKIGAGTLVLTGANTYTGTTTISNGFLNAAANGALGSGTGGTAVGTSSILVNSGGTLMLTNSSATDRVRSDAPITLGVGGPSTISTSGSGNVSEGAGAKVTNGGLPVGSSTIGLGSLTLQSNSTIDFSSLSGGTLTFAAFTPGTFTLNILNWTSSASLATLTSGTDGVDDRLIFGGGAVPNTAFITFDGAPAGFIPLDLGFYEVVPVPETSTWVTGALALAAIGLMSRKRFAKRSRVVS